MNSLSRCLGPVIAALLATGTARADAPADAPASAESAPAPAASPRLTPADQKALAEALSTVQRVEALAMADIFDELRAAHPGLEMHRGRGGLIKNDYRAYQWIEVRIGDREYWITAVYNDLDFNSGNFHSQYGRIQFWKDIRKIGHVSTPNDKQNGWWRPRMDHQWRKLPPTFIWREDFSARRVAELFGEFLAECGENPDARTSPKSEVRSPSGAPASGTAGTAPAPAPAASPAPEATSSPDGADKPAETAAP